MKRTNHRSARLLRISRRINARVGGDPHEALCSRAHRERWACAPLLDAMAWLIWREAGHCRAVAAHERDRMTGQPDQRARLYEGG